MLYTFEVGFEAGILCVGVPLHEMESVKCSVEISNDEKERILKHVNLADNKSKPDTMEKLREKEPELWARIDQAAQTAIRNYMVLRYAASGDIMLDEEQQRKWFEHDSASGEFVPENALEDAIYIDEMPDDEEGLFFLWQDFERQRIQEKGIDWFLSRYTLSDEDLAEFENIPYFFV